MSVHRQRARRNEPLDEETKKLKAKYSSSLSTLRELFPTWNDEDLLSVLAETQGDLEATVARIAEGHASQWAQVEKKKEPRAKSRNPDSDDKSASAAAVAGTTHHQKKPCNTVRSAPARGAPADRGRSRALKRTNGSSHVAATVVAQASASNATSTPGSWPKQGATDSSSEPSAKSEAHHPPAAAPAALASSTTWAAALGSKSKTVAPVAPKTSPKTDSKSEAQQASQTSVAPAEEAIAAPSEQALAASTTVAAKVNAPSEKLTWAAIAAPKVKEAPQPQPKRQQEQLVRPGASEPTNVPEHNGSVSTGVNQPLEQQKQPIEQPAEPSRREVPVVLPGSAKPVDRVNVQFGSLNLSDDTEVEQTQQEYTHATAPAGQVPQEVLQVQQASQQARPVQQLPQQAQPVQQQQYQYSQYRYGGQQQQQLQNQPQQKPYDSFAQNQYMYPGSHPAAYGTGYSVPAEYQPYGSADRNTLNYYYQQQQQGQQGQHGQQAQPQQQAAAGLPGQQQQSESTFRGGLDHGRFAAGSETAKAASTGSSSTHSPSVPTASPGIAALTPNQYQQSSINPYYMSPAYAAYYYQTYGQYNAQVAAAAAAQGYGTPQGQKGFFNQQSYYDSYRQQQQGQQQYQGQPGQQQGVQQQQQSQDQQQQPAQGAQPGQQSQLSGISDFLQREEGKPGSPQAHGNQVPLQNQQYLTQQNLYSYAGYGQYGGQQQQGRQGWGYGNWREKRAIWAHVFWRMTNGLV